MLSRTKDACPSAFGLLARGTMTRDSIAVMSCRYTTKDNPLRFASLRSRPSATASPSARSQSWSCENYDSPAGQSPGRHSALPTSTAYLFGIFRVPIRFAKRTRKNQVVHFQFFFLDIFLSLPLHEQSTLVYFKI